MPTVGTTSKPAYVYDAGSDTWIPIGPGEHSHSYIPNTLVDAKGDILTATAADTPTILTVGANDTVLTADSSTATGLKWAAVAAGGMDLLSTTTLSGTTVTVNSISGSYDHLLVTWNGVYHSANGDPYFRFNSDTGSNYSDWNVATYQTGPSALPDAHMLNDKLFCMFGGTSSDWDKYNNGNMWIYNYTTTGTVDIMIHSSSYNGTDRYSSRIVGRYKNTAAISSITFFQPNGTTNFSGGTLKVWGVK